MSKTEKLHERLSRIRKEKNLTAKAVAELIEVPESTYREWEYGRGMKLPPCQKICQVLGISLSELIVGEEPELSEVTHKLLEIEKSVHQIRVNLSSLI